MAIILENSTVKALEHRAHQMGVEVEVMTNELLKTVIADEETALSEFETFIRPRIESARRGEFVNQSVEGIFEEVLQEND